MQFLDVLRTVGNHFDVHNVCFCRRQRGCHLGHHTLAVGDGNGQIHLKRTGRLIGPFHAHKALAVLVLQACRHRAMRRVHHQALAAPQVTQYGVARNRAAAQRELDRRVLTAVQRNRAHAVAVSLTKALARQQQGVRPLASVAQQQHQALGHDVGNALAQANVGQQLLAVLAARESQQLIPGAGVGLGVRKALNALGPQGLGQQLVPELL